MSTIEELEAAIKDTTSMLNDRKSALSNYEDEYNSARRNGDEDMASYWQSQMRHAESRIEELEGVLADEQAELKRLQAASNTNDGDSNSANGDGSATDSTDDDSDSNSVNGDGSATDSTDDDSDSNSPISDGSATDSTVSANHYVYAGGDQVISDYAGQSIFLDTTPTDAVFAGGNFALISETGTLLIQNANDKIISFTDSEGAPYAKAYAATNPGVIDGRGLEEYEVITGSDLGGDVIFAGDGGSKLWGGSGIADDILIGGTGYDMFVCGKYEGSDAVLDAAPSDTILLHDVSLSDIVATASDGYSVGILFNTGNVLTVTGTNSASANFVLADGSTYWYGSNSNHWYQST